jgi:putative ABC transport system substrate-binding protein
MCTVAGGLLIAPLAVRGQQTTKGFRIGFLSATSTSTVSARLEAFRQGLRDLGYVEGKNIVIEYRYAEGNLDRLPGLAAALVDLKVDVIVAAGPRAIRPAMNASSTIPIIFAWDSDPVGSGFVASLARPGGNVTGLSTLAPEIGGKLLELLKETVPKLSRVTVFGNSTEPGNALALKETERAAAALGLQLQNLQVVSPKDIETAFRDASIWGTQAVLALNSPVLDSQRSQLAQLAVRNRLPVVYVLPEYVVAGGLMTYGVSLNDLFRRAAAYVDKILKGAKPADLPVEQPIKFEFIINLKAAEQIGLTIPQALLLRADKVIQ